MVEEHRPEHPLLESVYLKLERGTEHFDRLTDAIAAWVAGYNARGEEPLTYTSSVEGRGKRQRRVKRFDRVDPSPPRWGAIAGDAVHNTRSALDHLICALALLNESESVNDNAFPIYGPKEPDEDRKQRIWDFQLGGLHDAHRQAIWDMQ